MFVKIDRWLKRLYVACGILGAMFTMVIMLITVTDVMGRYLFNQPVKGGVEIVAQLIVVAVFMSLGAIQYRQGHISVDFVFVKLPLKTRNVLEVATLILFFVASALLVWRTGADMMTSWQFGGSTAGAVHIPYAPLRSIVFLGCVLLCVCLLLQIWGWFRGSIAKT